jgi:hypothetical protein
MRRYSTGALQIFLKFLSSNNRPSQCDEFRYDATMLVTLYTHRQDSVKSNMQHKPPFLQKPLVLFEVAGQLSFGSQERPVKQHKDL